MRWMDLEEGDVIDVGLFGLFIMPKDIGLRLVTRARAVALHAPPPSGTKLVDLSTSALTTHVYPGAAELPLHYSVLRGANVEQEVG